MSVPAIQTVLVIDDSADYRKLLVTFFHKVCPTARVDEYDPVYERPPENFPWSKYDLLILDYDLGGGENGLEWLRQYKTSSGFPPTIMLTAADDEELVVNAIRFGAQSFLRKAGLTKNILLESVNAALKKHKQDQQAADSQKLQVHLYNKEKFFDSLKSVKKNNAIFLVEIDKFQDLREFLGIFSIDNFVKYFSETISNTVKQNNNTGQMTRIGDSTVALLIQDEMDTAKSEILAKLICEAFDKAPYKHNDSKVDFSVNIGVKCIDDDKVNVEKILSRVEYACRKAREISGNSYIIEGDVDEKQAEYEKELFNLVKAALKENRVRPLFQTLVLVSGTAEKTFREIHQVRVNILDPGNNIIEPKKFVPILEKFESLTRLDRWIIRHCVQALTDLRKNNGLKLGIMMPISSQSINDKDLTDWIHKMVEYVKIPDLGNSLIFEIKARDFLTFHRQAKLQFNKFRVKLGALIALTNINDVSILDKCMQKEKFDFIIFSPEHTGENKMPIDQIQKMVNKAREYKAFTVASRIDTGEYLALAASAGTDYVLGHFVQPPMEKIIPTEEVVVR